MIEINIIKGTRIPSSPINHKRNKKGCFNWGKGKSEDTRSARLWRAYASKKEKEGQFQSTSMLPSLLRSGVGLSCGITPRTTTCLLSKRLSPSIFVAYHSSQPPHWTNVCMQLLNPYLLHRFNNHYQYLILHQSWHGTTILSVRRNNKVVCDIEGKR